jgi:hypothetical protein
MQTQEKEIISNYIDELKSNWQRLSDEERRRKLADLHFMIADCSELELELIKSELVRNFETESEFYAGIKAAKALTLIYNSDNNILTAINKIDPELREPARGAAVRDIIKQIAQSDSDTEVESYINALNERLNLSKKELRAIYNDIAKIRKRSTRKTKADQLIELALDSDLQLFHDLEREAYARVKLDNRFAIYKLKSKEFRAYLSELYYKAYNKSVNNEDKKTAIDTLSAIAIFENAEYELHLRVAEYENAIWYDLSDWRAVKVSPDGWEVVDTPPVLFRHYSHQKAQVEPVQGGDLKQVLNFVNLKNEEDKILLLAYLVAALVPRIPHPVLVLHGAQGAAKTTLFKIVRELIDPSLVASLTFSKDFAQFAQAASHHYCVFLDNLTTLPDWLSDCICRLVTGDGFTKRELYTDDDDIIYAFKRLAGLNGINLVANRADLLDRSLIFELKRISENERIDEKQLWSEFNQAKPQILGGLFGALSIAMREYSNIKLKSLPRMADFAIWGCAAAKVLGYSDDDFIEAYLINIDRQNEEALSSSAIAQAVISFMQDKTEYQANSAQLLADLTVIAEELQLTRAKNWPRDPRWLWRRLKEAEITLSSIGIELDRFQKSTGNRERVILLKNTTTQGLL